MQFGPKRILSTRMLARKKNERNKRCRIIVTTWSKWSKPTLNILIVNLENVKIKIEMKWKEEKAQRNNYCKSSRHILFFCSVLVGFVCRWKAVAMISWFLLVFKIFFWRTKTHTRHHLMNEDVHKQSSLNSTYRISQSQKFHLQLETKYAWNELMIVFSILTAIATTTTKN